MAQPERQHRGPPKLYDFSLFNMAFLLNEFEIVCSSLDLNRLIFILNSLGYWSYNDRNAENINDSISK